MMSNAIGPLEIGCCVGILAALGLVSLVLLRISRAAKGGAEDRTGEP